jgi:hypothetical protein
MIKYVELSRERQGTLARANGEASRVPYSEHLGRLLLTVTGTFSISGRGFVLVPGLRPVGDERFRIGDSILLRRPDGVEIRTSIGGLELPTPNRRHEVVILLTELSKIDVPVGTEVWSA